MYFNLQLRLTSTNVEEILKSMIFEEKTAHCIYRGSASICIASTQDGDENTYYA